MKCPKCGATIDESDIMINLDVPDNKDTMEISIECGECGVTSFVQIQQDSFIVDD